MKYAIISSRFGPTPAQVRAFKDFLKDCHPEKDEFIIGGDAGDVSIFDVLINGRWKVSIYPHSTSNTEFAFEGAIKSVAPAQLKDRNKMMIQDSEAIIGIPQSFNENEDSPNWKTIRFAAANQKDLFVISPAGWVWQLENNRG